MFFDKDTFQKILAAQCLKFGIESGQAWELMPHVFAAELRAKGESDWTTAFYFDSRELKRRCLYADIDQLAKLLVLAGLIVGCPSEDLDNPIRIAYFVNDRDPVGQDPKNIINYASQLFVKLDDSEVEWPDSAKPIEFDRSP
ncbi:MAG: hypothetical protein KA731_02265 [Candidatus Moranbacteria bacterium]|nr:hypothetical protein [Candidatus Moranbacteria bacterium]MBP6034229.1 hypothetical protein [Candidatus Moranbacteria bacterium]